MKKVKKIITGFLTVFLFMAMVLPMTTVKASEEKEVAEKRMYTVTFRAGNIACFDIYHQIFPHSRGLVLFSLLSQKM